MRLLAKLLALLVFGPIVIALLGIATVVAIIGLPLLWEEITMRLSAPPDVGKASPSAD